MEIFFYFHQIFINFITKYREQINRAEQICTVQYHLQTYHESQSSDYIRKRLSIQNKNNWSQDSPGGPHKRRRGFFLHSQLLLVSYLAGKNQRRTKQDHKYRKWIPRAQESGVFTNNVWNCMFAFCVCFCLPQF